MRRLLTATLVLLPFASQAGAPRIVTLDVKNMTCPVCPITVKKALEKVPGVAAAKIDRDQKVATVTFDPELTDAGKLVEATTEAGYPSIVRPSP